MRAFKTAVAVLLLSTTIAFAADWHVGDQIQAWNVAWYDGAIVEVGTGNHAGYYLVHFDRFATPQWVKAEYIRARAGAPPPAGRATPSASSGSAPPAGRYTCMGYSGGRGQFRWYLEISNNTYHQRTPDLPAGNYTFNPQARRLDFVSGPYQRNNWIGLFSVERGGATDKIVLRDRASEAQGPRVKEYSNIYCTLSSGG